MPLPRRDYLEFLFNGGRGIRRAQLHEDAGLPSYAAGSHKAVYVPADRDIVVTIDALGTEPAPRPCLLYFIIPPDIDRAGDGLTLVGNGTSGSLLFLDGRRVAARDLTPGALGVVLAQQPGGTQGWIFIDQVHPRPQDFDLVLVWVDAPRRPAPPAGTLTPALVAAGTTFTVPQFPIPAYSGSEGFAWLYFGVPAVAPPLDLIQEVGQSGTLLFADSDETTPVGGVAFRWYRTRGQRRTFTSPNEYRFVFGPYT